MAASSRLSRCLVRLLIWTTVTGASQNIQQRQAISGTDNCTAVRNTFSNLTNIPPTGNPLLGHQNLTYCCARAVFGYFENNCTDTADIKVFDLTSDSQWPCGAQWEQDPAGAPIVQARWQWLSTNCPGWQLSQANDPSQWAQLLIGFLLPAVIFTLNIPRRRKLRIWDGLFPEDIAGARFLVALLGAAVAMIIVIFDNILWLLTVFAAAGPCLISGIYEGWLDHKVLAFLNEPRHPNDLPLAFRARMLFTILTGNLDLHPAWSDTMLLASSLDELDEVAAKPSTSNNGLSEEPTHEPRGRTEISQGGGNPMTNSNNNGSECAIKSATGLDHDLYQIETVRSTDASETSPMFTSELAFYRRRKIIGKVSSRLSSMLACQYGFGCTIGGPVLYYIGAFIYTLVQIRETYGARDLAHALAYGMWFMVIPHIAIIAGFLLGGNNPNTLEGIVGAKDWQYFVDHEQMLRTRSRQLSSYYAYREPDSQPGSRFKIMERVYRAAYMPASLWNRGQSKQQWLIVLSTNALLRYKDNSIMRGGVEGTIHRFIHTSGMFDLGTWLYLWLAATSLIFIPSLLGFLIAYYTPQVGLSCRSFTFTIYLSSQTLLLVLWTIRMTFGDRFWRRARTVQRYLALPAKKTELKRAITTLSALAHAETTFPSDTHVGLLDRLKGQASDLESDHGSRQHFTSQWPATAEWIYHILLLLGFGVAILSSIGGVLMELLGVFRSNFCNLNVTHWLPSNRSDTWATISSNSAEAIRLAKATWTALGTISLLFLVFTCYIGWWYQRRLRRHFSDIAGRLDPDAVTGQPNRHQN